MRAITVLLAMVAASYCQTVEAVVILPDSLSGLGALAYACREDSGNRFWVGGLEGTSCGVVSADRRERVARVPALAGSRYGNAILYNPLSNRIYVSSAAQAQVAVVDAATGERRALLPVGSDPRGLALSTMRNKVYVTNYAASSVTVLDGQADTVITTLWVGQGPQHPCYNRFADCVYTSNYSGQAVAVIDCRTDHLLTTVDIGADVRPLVYSPSANKVYVGHAWDSTVTVIEAGSHTIEARIPAGPTHFYWPLDFCLSPSGGKVYCALYSQEVVVIDEEGDSLLARIAMPGGAGAMAAHAGLNRLFVVNPDNHRVAVVDCASDSVVATFSTGVAAGGVVFDTSGHTGMLFCRETDEVLLFDPESDSIHTRLQYGWSVPGALCTDETGDRVWCADERRSNVIRIDPLGNVPCCTMPAGNGPAALLYAEGPGKLYCASTDSVSVYDAGSDSLLAVVPAGRIPRDLAWSPTSGMVYCTDYHANNDSVTVISAVTDSIVARVAVGARPYGLAWSPAGNKVYVACFGGANVSVVDCATNRPVRNLPAGSGACALARVVGTGRVFCANADANTVTVYDGDEDTLVAVTAVPAGPRALAVDQVRGRVFCACADGCKVAVLNGATGSIEATVDVPEKPWALSYSPGNDRVYCTFVDAGRVGFVDAALLAYAGDVEVGRYPQAMARSNSTGRTYVSCSQASGLWVLSDLPVGVTEPDPVSTRPIGNWIAAGGELPVQVRDAVLLDVVGRVVREPGKHGSKPCHLPAGAYFAVRADGTLAARVLIVR